MKTVSKTEFCESKVGIQARSCAITSHIPSTVRFTLNSEQGRAGEGALIAF